MSSSNLKQLSSKYDDEDDIRVGESHGLLSPNAPPGFDIPMCGCLSVKFYQPYFDVDTEDVRARLARALVYCRREQNFLEFIGNKPDAYGPFWITTTLVFIVAVTSHINNWMSSWIGGKNWKYDFSSFVTIASFVYGFTAFLPLVVWFILRQLGAPTTFSTILCVYGYSLAIFLPITLLCLVPSEAFIWIDLLVAGITSAVFLIRNIGPLIIQYAGSQAKVMLAVLGIIQIIFAISIKLCFFSSWE